MDKRFKSKKFILPSILPPYSLSTLDLNHEVGPNMSASMLERRGQPHTTVRAPVGLTPMRGLRIGVESLSQPEQGYS